jgi:hypothetical protein
LPEDHLSPLIILSLAVEQEAAKALLVVAVVVDLELRQIFH